MNNYDFFSSPIGLGHVTRDIAIVKNLKDFSVNFVTGSGAAKILKKLDYNIDDVYNPPSFVVENGVLNNQTKWLWSYYQYYKNCKNISKKIIKKNKNKSTTRKLRRVSLFELQNSPKALLFRARA